MSRYKISILLVFVLLLQIALPPSSSLLTNEVHAAVTGPVITSKSPANTFGSVGLSAPLSFTFDESVIKGTGPASITIYNYTNNSLFETFNVATSNRVTLDAAGRTVTVQPSASYTLNTEYYVFIDQGAFVNASNGANFSGISNAAEWNFKTVSQVDSTPPDLRSVVSPAPESGGAPITTIITLPFNENVYTTYGAITLVSAPSATAYDSREIAVNSVQVVGSGTSTLTIKPTEALYPNTTYTVTIPSHVIQDSSGNRYAGTTWRFTTAPAPVNATGLSPANSATSVGVSSSFSMSFDKNVIANAGKYISLVRVNDNYADRYQATDTSRIIVSGNTVTFTPPKLLANTRYYILIDAGAFADSSTRDWFQGISNAATWSFTTSPGDETDPPRIQSTYPAHTAAIGTLNSGIEINFTEPVYPSAGNIEIRNSNNTIFATIPVTSSYVTGGGTSKITINPNKTFINNSQYYVVIGSGAFRDAAGNYFAGITANSWTFRVTQDTVRPTIESQYAVNNTQNVLTDAYFSAIFSETIVKGSGTITIRPVTPATGVVDIPANFYINPDNSRQLVITLPTGTTMVPNTNYYIEISPTAIYDLSDNAFLGIQNAYQWAFKTIGVDTTPPAVSKMEVRGSTIVMTFNEDLKASSVPALSSFYVTVNGERRELLSAVVAGSTVTLTLAGTLVNIQTVKLSYSKPTTTTGGIQDITGNQALSIANQDVAFAVDATAPTLSSGTATGSVVTLTFNKALASVNNLAYQQFRVNIGGASYTPTAISINGAVVTMSVNATIANQSVYVSYTPGSYPLKSTDGGTVAAFNSYYITNTVDVTAPTLQGVYANGSIITLSYNESLSTSAIPPVSSYTVSVNGSIRSIVQISVSGSQVLLTLSSSISLSDTIYVSYNMSSPRVVDLAGNAAASFSTQRASMGSTSSSLSSAVIKGNSLVLTFGETMNSSYVPYTTQFSVLAGSTTATVSSVSISGSTVTLTLATAIASTSSVTFSYYASGTTLRTSSGKIIENILSQSVTNSSSIIDLIPGEFTQSSDGGVLMTSGAFTKTSHQTASGRSSVKYSISADKLAPAYQAARTANLTKSRIIVEIPSSENAAVVAVPLSTLLNASSINTSPFFVVKYNGTSYEIPLGALNYSRLTSTVGSTGELLIEIELGTTSLTTALTNRLNVSTISLLSGIVHFQLYAVSGTMKSEITELNGYATLSVDTSLAVTRKNTAIVRVDPVAGALTYVPTMFSTLSGKTVATFRSKSIGAFALVSNSVSLVDISSHWAGPTAQSLANKNIVAARTGNQFVPDRPITRGEFATYIAKGLGLPGNQAAAAKYSDVNIGSELAAYIGAASEAGIVLGYTDGTFKADKYIQRQEMSAMMTRAASAAGATIQLPSSASTYLQPFTDRNSISSWARTDAAKAIYTGIIGGKTTKTFSPLTNATRAEAVVMIKRLLEHIQFLNT
ncbi:Ig-like domain-containing protein [Paenibacillus sp. KS-LC4]|uniref:Ig-like domain-containing protein n=1 Tax=Paenibacillus sp. KS-LC4 TaxID=2979727 RepID=UPI0030CB6B52